MQDLDGLPMYLLSNDKVTILVQHRPFDPQCDWSKSCTWEYTLSPTSASLDQTEQRELVDQAFAAIPQLDL